MAAEGTTSPVQGLVSQEVGLFYQLSVTFLDTKNYPVSSSDSVVLSLVNRRHFSWVLCARSDHTQIGRKLDPTQLMHPNSVFSFKKELFPFSHVSPLPARERQFYHQARALPSKSFPPGVVGEGDDSCTGLCLTHSLIPSILMCCCVTKQGNVSTTEYEIDHPTLLRWI